MLVAIRIFMLLLLVLMSVWDIREAKIPVFLIYAGMVPTIICLGMDLINNEINIANLACSTLPGLIFMLISISTEQIGMADGVILLVLGLMMGLTDTMIIWVVSMGLAFIYSLIIVVIRFGGGKKKFPYCPFITAGYLTVLCVSIHAAMEI